METKHAIISEEDFRYLLSGARPSLDLAWFAVDREGRVAGFTTAGFAEFPTLVLRDRATLNRAYSLVAEIPTEAPLFVGDTWMNWARKGLFGYDWDYNLGHPAPLPYRRQSVPARPILISDLPHDLFTWLSPIAFMTLSFAEACEIRVSDYFNDVI